MLSEIISIGDELLIGQVVNTNASYISEKMGEIGVAVRRVTTVGDRVTDIHDALAAALKNYDIIIITGGLGPTHDDITKKAVADFFELGFSFNEEAYQNCKAIFDKRGVQMPESNRSQGEVISGSLVLQNTRGTAPGMILHDLKNFPNKYVVIMPGVPQEMKTMTDISVVPYFRKKSKTTIKHQVLMTTGVGESLLAQIIGDESQLLIGNATLAYLPSQIGVRLRITASGSDAREVESRVKTIEERLMTRIQKYVYATSDKTLEEIVAAMLVERNLTLAVAESFTGGLLAHRLTNISGSSKYFLQGVVTYSNDSKEKELGVKKETLVAFGAVSGEVAAEMAEGGRLRSGADICVSTTGIAGPTGATDTKPVGLVFIGFSSADHKLAKRFQLGSERLRNKEQGSQLALDMIRKMILKID
jgi:nicotinamide-nucleotide amidase